jgi:hypothetical protein
VLVVELEHMGLAQPELAQLEPYVNDCGDDDELSYDELVHGDWYLLCVL